MLIDPRIQEQDTAKSGFSPNVQNNQVAVTVSGFEKGLF
jgi:hypothetical protein